jgi:ubiquinone/menaquinone biosynthesis C-methylase UbiE
MAQPTRIVPDKAHLVGESYATDEPLSVRIETHRRYSVPPVDLPAWVLDRYAWRGDETVLDVGTGTGQYLAPLRRHIPGGRIIGADLAPGMLRDLRAKGVPGGASLLNADAEALPLADAACDVMIASYVLFFVPDIPRALAEARRVLRPGGALLAATLAHVYMDELHAAINAAMKRLGAAHDRRWDGVPRRFSLGNGAAQLEPYFARVTLHQFESALVFPQAGPVLAYVASTRDTYRDDIPPGRTWNDLMAALRDVVDAEIAAHGEFRVSKPAGVLIAIK